MEEIPVTFELKGKEYKGFLSRVSGAGSNASFHLTVNQYHLGQLSYFEGGRTFEAGWRFTSNTYPELELLSEFFGSVLVSWVDSHPEFLK